VSWSLLTVHTTSAIALQLMWGLYNGQHRTLTLKIDTKNFISTMSEFYFSETLTIWFGKYNPN